MKISFICSAEANSEVFEEFVKKVSKKVSGLEISKRFVPFPEDLPIVVFEESEDNDFIFAFSIVEDSERNLILDKLIDVELKTGIRIMKIIETEDYFDSREDPSEDYLKILLGILFEEESFEPKKE